MTTDDLSAPLGQDRAASGASGCPSQRRRHWPRCCGLVSCSSFVGFAIFNHDPLGGEPVARVRRPGRPPASEDKPRRRPTRAEQPGPPAAEAADSDRDSKTITIIDGSSGKRQDVVVVAVPTAPPMTTTPHAGRWPASIRSCSENLALWHDSDDRRRRPEAVQGLCGRHRCRARASRKDAEHRHRRDGLGVGAAKTTDAIMKLPGAVTLAFTPYGADPAQAGRARARAEATRCCCRCRWSRSTIPTTIPARRPC